MSSTVTTRACGLQADAYQNDPDYRLVSASANGRVYRYVGEAR